MNKEEKIIMFESDEAAQIKTITGWVSSNGRYWGQDERAARYDGSTHHVCECGEVAERAYTRCKTCRDKQAIETWKAYPYKEWDGKALIYLSGPDKYFRDESELMEFCDEEQVNANDLMLVLCEPMHYSTVGYDDICQDSHEDWEPEDELTKAMNEFNKVIQSLPAHSWYPAKIRTSYDYTYKPESD